MVSSYARSAMAPAGGQDFFLADAQDLIEFAGGIAHNSDLGEARGFGNITPGGATSVAMPVRRYAD